MVYLIVQNGNKPVLAYKEPEIQETRNTRNQKYKEPEIQGTRNTRNHKYKKP